jgi:hypothetical protein
MPLNIATYLLHAATCGSAICWCLLPQWCELVPRRSMFWAEFCGRSIGWYFLHRERVAQCLRKTLDSTRTLVQNVCKTPGQYQCTVTAIVQDLGLYFGAAHVQDPWPVPVHWRCARPWPAPVHWRSFCTRLPVLWCSTFARPWHIGAQDLCKTPGLYHYIGAVLVQGPGQYQHIDAVHQVILFLCHQAAVSPSFLDPAGLQPEAPRCRPGSDYSNQRPVLHCCRLAWSSLSIHSCHKCSRHHLQPAHVPTPGPRLWLCPLGTLLP